MSNTRCIYCNKFYNKTKEQKRCKECEWQFKTVFESMYKSNVLPMKITDVK